MRETLKFLWLIPLILLVLFLGKRIDHWKSAEYLISAGKPGGGYEAFAKGLVELGKKDDHLSLKFIESEGSVENATRVSSGEADFGLVQQGVALDDNLAVVASIYQDIVHILVKRGGSVSSMLDLSGKKIFYGMDGSGAKVVAKELFTHYGVQEIKRAEMTPHASIDALKEGQIDAVILVTSMRAPQIIEAMSTGDIKHLSLGDPNLPNNAATGISHRYVHLRPAVIPQHTYGRVHQRDLILPEKPICTLSLPSRLVCRKEAHLGAIHRLTKSIFTNRHFLSQYNSDAYYLKEPITLDNELYPYHEGAEKYYQRKNPTFLLIYAEVIALLLSGLIALIGLIAAIKRWIAMRNKNRIDVYYAHINVSLKRLQSHQVEDLLEQAMDEVHRQMA